MTTLLDELGGKETIELVVAAFYERVLGDANLQPFFRKTSMTRLQQLQVDFFCAALGGRADLYRGRDMKRAHAGMQIGDEHFDAVAGHLIATLRAFDVGQGHIDRIVALIAPLRTDVVET